MDAATVAGPSSSHETQRLGSTEYDTVARELRRSLAKKSPQAQRAMVEKVLSRHLATYWERTLQISAYWQWYSQADPLNSARFRGGLGEGASNSLRGAIRIAEEANAGVRAKMESVASKWPEWDWIVPGNHTPVSWTKSMLEKLVTLSLRTNDWQQAMSQLKDAALERRRGVRKVSGPDARNLKLSTSDIVAVLARYPVPPPVRSRRRRPARVNTAGAARGTQPEADLSDTDRSIEDGRGEAHDLPDLDSDGLTGQADGLARQSLASNGIVDDEEGEDRRPAQRAAAANAAGSLASMAAASKSVAGQKRKRATKPANRERGREGEGEGEGEGDGERGGERGGEGDEMGGGDGGGDEEGEEEEEVRAQPPPPTRIDRLATAISLQFNEIVQEADETPEERQASLEFLGRFIEVLGQTPAHWRRA